MAYGVFGVLPTLVLYTGLPCPDALSENEQRDVEILCRYFALS